jgi:hypothetical protein
VEVNTKHKLPYKSRVVIFLMHFESEKGGLSENRRKTNGYWCRSESITLYEGKASKYLLEVSTIAISIRGIKRDQFR